LEEHFDVVRPEVGGWDPMLDVQLPDARQIDASRGVSDFSITGQPEDKF